jgi:hypothetical protein
LSAWSWAVGVVVGTEFKTEVVGCDVGLDVVCVPVGWEVVEKVGVVKC